MQVGAVYGGRTGACTFSGLNITAFFFIVVVKGIAPDYMIGSNLIMGGCRTTGVEAAVFLCECR